MAKTAVLYARYSTDMQNERSVEDQFALCRKYAAREGLEIVDVYSDKAKSGASMFDRDGLGDMLHAAKQKPLPFDAVITESLDRISRDQSDLPGIFKRLTFLGIEMHTANEGPVTNLHIGIRGIIGSVFLKDMGDKIRRGHDGRVRDGKIPGAVTYGYRTVPGKPGEREIDPEHAKIVRRIFTEYATGRSPRAIAKDLTEEGVPTPAGSQAWHHQTFVGGRREGLLGNRLYIGELVWNKRRSVKNPDNGRIIKRSAPPEDLIVTKVPHLRIIDDALWHAANTVRSDRALAKFGPHGKVRRRHTSNREHLFAGLLRCGACGSHMRIVQSARSGAGRVGCASAHQHSACNHTKSYDLGMLRAGFLEQGRKHLSDAEVIRETLRSFHREFAEQTKQAGADRLTVRKRLTNIQASLDRITYAIEHGGAAIETLVDRLNALEVERVGLQERLRLLDAQSNVVELHPRAIDGLVANVTWLFDTLRAAGDDPETRMAFRNLFSAIEIVPTPKRMPYLFRPYLRIGALAGIDLAPKRRSAGEMLAEQGLPYSTFGNTEKAGLPKMEYADCVGLGTWSAAA